MPREIIHISVGQCGNQIGSIFWGRMLEEHNLKKDGHFNMDHELKYEDYFKLDKISVYFDEGKEDDHYVPRTIMIDLEPGVINKVLHSPIGKLFHPDYVLSRASGAGNNWAKGHYTLGSEIIDETLDIIRRQTEGCDQLQGFQITHSIGGGTGSGFGTLMLQKIRDIYPDRLTSTFSIYPTPKVSDIVVEPYNAILAISHLISESDCTFVTDNEALFNISQNVLKQSNPSFADLNWILSLVMGGVTASLRFPGILNCDLRKMAVNLVPFPRLHFFSTAYSPLLQLNNISEYNLTEWDLKRISINVWSKKNLLTSIKRKHGKVLAATIMYRGKNISTAEVDNYTKDMLNEYSDHFVEWIPHNVKTACITLKPTKTNHSATLISNVSSVKDCFERIWMFYTKLFKKKAFLHWYKGEGMDELEFNEAESEVKDLIMEYHEKQEIVIDYENLFGNNNDDEFEEETEEEEDEEEEEEEDKYNHHDTQEHDGGTSVTDEWNKINIESNFHPNTNETSNETSHEIAELSPYSMNGNGINHNDDDIDIEYEWK